MGILELMLVVFIAFKVIGVITWSWGMVLIPLYLMGLVYGVILTLWIIGFRSINKEFKKFKN